MRVVNFAHGELYAFGAYTVYLVAAALGLNFFLGLVVAVIAGALLGALIEIMLLRPMRSADIDTVMLVMIGAWIVMQNTELLVWGGVAKAIVTPFPDAPLVIGPVSISWLRLFVLAMALLLIGGSYVLIHRTKLGKAMRATFQDADTAALMGVNIKGIFTATFAIGSGLAAAAGALLGPVFLVTPTMGDLASLKAFAIIILLTIPLWLQDQYILHILITTGIFIIAAMSLNLLLGYTGQLSLGHVAFFGIGAYASALTTLGFDVELFAGVRVVHEPWPAVAGFFAGTIVAGVSGYVIGRLSFKVRGAYFVIVTISFAEVTRLVALNWVELTQGPLALTNIPPYTLGFPGLGDYTLWNKTAYYYLVVVVGLIAYVVISRLVGSRIGRAMIALKENETLASSVGIDVTRYLVLAAVASAAMAGAASTR